MSEKPSELSSNSGKTEIPKPAKPRAASKGKRLLALLLDFILALLLMNTLDQYFRSEDWDLKMQTPGVEKMLIFYGLPNHAGGEVLKRGKKGEREGERLAFALCSIKNYTRMPKGKYAVNSSVLGSRAEQLWQHGR